MRTILLGALVMMWPAMALAACGECAKPCGDPCPKPCKPCVKKVKCCEKVAVCCPVEKKHYKLVKVETCVPKCHTKCVKDSCDPCAPARQVTWTTFHKKCSYRWQCYTTVENKTRYIKRCTERTVDPCSGAEVSAATPLPTENVAN